MKVGQTRGSFFLTLYRTKCVLLPITLTEKATTSQGHSQGSKWYMCSCKKQKARSDSDTVNILLPLHNNRSTGSHEYKFRERDRERL